MIKKTNAELEHDRRFAVQDHQKYLATIESLEPDISMIDPGAFYASAAISLKRIADILEAREKRQVEYWLKRELAEKTPVEF